MTVTIIPQVEVEMPTWEELVHGVNERRAYYWQKVIDETCEAECGGRCAYPHCETIKERFEEMIEDHTCQHCGRLIGPNDDRFNVPGVGIFCNRDHAENGVL